VRSGESFTLDASSSYDQDLGLTVTGIDAGLSFAWSCVQISPALSSTCPLTVTSATDTGTSFVVSAIASGLGTTAEITVVISSGSRSASTAVSMLTQEATSPVVSLVPDVSYSNYLASTSLTILGNVLINVPTDSSSITGVTTWSVDDPSVSIETNALTPLNATVSTTTTGENVIPFNILIRSNSLLTSSTYVFTLTCALLTGGSALASITIVTNGAPFINLVSRFCLFSVGENVLCDGCYCIHIWRMWVGPFPIVHWPYDKKSVGYS